MTHEKKRILHIIPDIGHSGGVQYYVLNICKGIDKNKFQCDILHHNWRQNSKNHSNSLENNFKETGARIYSIPDPSDNLFGFLKESKNIMLKLKNYDIVHVHSMGTSARFLSLSKKYKIKNRIFHIHEAKLSESLLRRLRNYFLLKISKSKATKFIAVSNLAGDKVLKNKNFELVYAGLDLEKFAFNKEYRKKRRKEENCSDQTYVIGCVGRITKQKNYFYMIDLFKQIKKMHSDAILVFVGKGPLENELRNYSRNAGLYNDVKFLGNKQNVNEYYSAFDALVMPSFYEGLPLVALEAQVSGLSVFLSNNISKEASLLNCQHFSLKEDTNSVAEKICEHLNNKNRSVNPFIFQKFSIEELTKNMEKIYESL